MAEPNITIAKPGEGLATVPPEQLQAALDAGWRRATDDEEDLLVRRERARGSTGKAALLGAGDVLLMGAPSALARGTDSDLSTDVEDLKRFNSPGYLMGAGAAPLTSPITGLGAAGAIGRLAPSGVAAEALTGAALGVGSSVASGDTQAEHVVANAGLGALLGGAGSLAGKHLRYAGLRLAGKGAQVDVEREAEATLAEASRHEADASIIGDRARRMGIDPSHLENAVQEHGAAVEELRSNLGSIPGREAAEAVGREQGDEETAPASLGARLGRSAMSRAAGRLTEGPDVMLTAALAPKLLVAQAARYGINALLRDPEALATTVATLGRGVQVAARSAIPLSQMALVTPPPEDRRERPHEALARIAGDLDALVSDPRALEQRLEPAQQELAGTHPGVAMALAPTVLNQLLYLQSQVPRPSVAPSLIRDPWTTVPAAAIRTFGQRLSAVEDPIGTIGKAIRGRAPVPLVRDTLAATHPRIVAQMQDMLISRLVDGSLDLRSPSQYELRRRLAALAGIGGLDPSGDPILVSKLQNIIAGGASTRAQTAPNGAQQNQPKARKLPSKEASNLSDASASAGERPSRR